MKRLLSQGRRPRVDSARLRVRVVGTVWRVVVVRMRVMTITIPSLVTITPSFTLGLLQPPQQPLHRRLQPVNLLRLPVLHLRHHLHHPAEGDVDGVDATLHAPHSAHHIDMALRVLLQHVLDVVRLEGVLELSQRHLVLRRSDKADGVLLGAAEDSTTTAATAAFEVQGVQVRVRVLLRGGGAVVVVLVMVVTVMVMVIVVMILHQAELRPIVHVHQLPVKASSTPSVSAAGHRLLRHPPRDGGGGVGRGRVAPPGALNQPHGGNAPLVDVLLTVPLLNLKR